MSFGGGASTDNSSSGPSAFDQRYGQGFPGQGQGGQQMQQQRQQQQLIQHGPGPEGQNSLPQRYKFNAEELRVLKECNRESFYFRSLPLGTALGVGMYYAVRMGYLKPSARWGAGPKMLAGSVIGYFLGKLSYQSKCAEKLMQIPNSPLADLLRRQKGRIGFQESLSMEPGFVTSAPIVGGGAEFSEYGQGPQEPGSFSDIGDTRPMQSFDNVASTFTNYDYGKYDTTKQMMDDDNLPPKRSIPSSTSYDELRRMNREEYENKAHGLPSGPIRSSNSPLDTMQSRPPPSQYPVGDSTMAKKNAYGDVWDDKTQ